MPSSPRLSIEFFPAATEPQTEAMMKAAKMLAVLSPEFVSVTFGAGGSAQDKSLDSIRRLEQAGFDVCAHLTCAGQSREATLRTAGRMILAGAGSFLALRGDPQNDDPHFIPHRSGYSSSLELLYELEARTPMPVRVAAYPEPHPDSLGMDADINFLKRKSDAGATEAITQFSFDTEAYLRLRDRAVAAGISMPIRAGILPVKNWETARKFAARCGASVPAWMDRAFAEGSADQQQITAAAICAEQCRTLLSEGMDRLHFYGLNRADLVLDTCFLMDLHDTPANARDPLCDAASNPWLRSA